MAAPVPSRARAKKMSPPRKGSQSVACPVASGGEHELAPQKIRSDEQPEEQKSKISGHEQQSADDGNGEQDEEDYHHRHRAHAKNKRASRRSLEAPGGSPQRPRDENS